MKNYKVNEIFYSLQGEGVWSGRAAVFIRFSLCNLRCPFCDTDFSKYEEMTASDIVERVKNVGKECRFIVLTGGEPTLQVDSELINALHEKGYYLSMETNGTHEIPRGIDWVTCSPKTAYIEKDKARVHIKEASEIKVVFDGKHEIDTYGIHSGNLFLQPCDTGDKEQNKEILNHCIAYILEHPEWRLSLQTQKIVGVR